MYQVRPRGFDPFIYDPYGYWGAVDTTTPIIILALTKGILLRYTEDRLTEFIFEDEVSRDFIYKEDRIFDFSVYEDNNKMARVFYTEKQPNESITCNIDFTDSLDDSEIISSVDTTAFNEALESCWATIGGGTRVSTDGKSINVGIVGGTAGEQYHINLLCTLDTLLPNRTEYDKLEADLYVSVKEL
jgi:hypothetical protein